MNEIPKRPKDELKLYEGALGFDHLALEIERRIHEHAVAVRAVEALRDLASLPPHVRYIECKHPCCNALRDIEASGWKP